MNSPVITEPFKLFIIKVNIKAFKKIKNNLYNQIFKPNLYKKAKDLYEMVDRQRMQEICVAEYNTINNTFQQK